MSKYTKTSWYFEKEPGLDLNTAIYVYADKDGVGNGQEIFHIWVKKN